MLSDNWNELSPEEKREARFDSWQSAEGVEFASPEVKKKYTERVQLIRDVVALKKPGRVPVCPNVGFFPAMNAGITAQDAMYDYEKLGMAWKKYHDDYRADALASSMIATPGKVFDILDYKLYRWPGHGTPPDTPYQCFEREYMKPDEYDALINDPSGYWMRFYMPRIFGVLSSWTQLSPFCDMQEILFVPPGLIPMGTPPLQESFKKLMEAGNATLEWAGAAGAIDGEITATHGVINVLGGFSKAPFDSIGDTLRGTQGIMVDMYRRPEKLEEALTRFVPLMIDMGVRWCNVNNNPMAFIPLHKGADGFMSDKAFARFYWPSLKAVLLGLIEEGLVPYVFVEGGYNERLDYLADPELPRGSVVWIFDKTDMTEVKNKLGGVQPFGGNVPVSLLKTGTPDDVAEYVRNLLENVGDEGGYILTTGGVVDDASHDNFEAMVETALDFEY